MTVRKYGRFKDEYFSHRDEVMDKIARDNTAGGLAMDLSHYTHGDPLCVSILIQYEGNSEKPEQVIMHTVVENLNADVPEAVMSVRHPMPLIKDKKDWDSAWYAVADQFQSDLVELYGLADAGCRDIAKVIDQLSWMDFKEAVSVAADICTSAENGEEFMKTMLGGVING